MKLRQRIKAVQTYLRQRGEALCFDEIRDPRKARGRRWSLNALLSTAVFSLMALARSKPLTGRADADGWISGMLGTWRRTEVRQRPRRSESDGRGERGSRRFEAFVTAA